MRFLALFFRYLSILVLVGGLGVLLGREVLLFWAAEQIARDARSLILGGRWNETATRCQAAPGVSGTNGVLGNQVRFLDGQQYALEVKCLFGDPAVKSVQTLPRFVTKTTGSAGFFANTTDQLITGEVTITVLNRSRIVYADGDRVSHTWGVTTTRSQTPESVCTGHGLSCCNDYEQQGEGEVMSLGVTDCPGNCYPRCLQRPVLLAFQSDPFTNHESRRTEVSGAQALVLFSYTYDDTYAAIDQVTIDFGDGQKQTINAAMQQVSKTYTCQQAQCEYVVTVSAVDVRGVQSKPTRLSTMTVVVTP